MSAIIIGKVAPSYYHNVTIDLSILMTTQLLLAADPGGGKTWAMKRLVEQSCGKVGIFIIDPEGEFSPLRQKLDFFLVGNAKGADTPADVRSASKVALALLANRVNAICDLYEIPNQREQWLSLFLDALINAPKNLRRPYLVIIDEAHIFAPEKGEGSSLASNAMRDLFSRGRKRLLCGIVATQRVAKLDKSVTTFCQNRMVGPTFDPLNQERSANELGIHKEKKIREAFYDKIKMADPGTFYVLGRAISRELLAIRTGPITSPHGEEALKFELEPPPPTEKVRELLARLGDLPKQAEEEARTIADYKKQLRELKTQLKAQPRIEVPKPIADSKAVERAIAPLRTMLEKAMKIIVKLNAIGFEGADVKEEDIDRLIKATAIEVRKLAKSKLAAKARELERLKQEAALLLKSIERVVSKEAISINVDVHKVSGAEIQTSDLRRPAAAQPLAAHPRPEALQMDGDLPRAEQRVLRAMSELNAIGRLSAPKEMIAGWAGYSPTSGGFNNLLGKLKGKGLIGYPQTGAAALTTEGMAITGELKAPDQDEVNRRVMSVCSNAEQKVLRALMSHGRETIPVDQIAQESGYRETSGGYNNLLGSLRTKGFLDRPRPGYVQCADWLFID